MNITDHSFHDCQILEIRELPDQILDFHIDFFTDWENHISEYRILRFIDVTEYSSTFFPCGGSDTILYVNELPDHTVTTGSFSSKITYTRKVVELLTTMGERVIQYNSCELIQP